MKPEIDVTSGAILGAVRGVCSKVNYDFSNAKIAFESEFKESAEYAIEKVFDKIRREEIKVDVQYHGNGKMSCSITGPKWFMKKFKEVQEEDF